MKYSVYANRGDEKQIENEELESFIRSVLDSIDGVDVSEVWPEGQELTPEVKIKLRKFLEKFGIDIIHDGERGYKMYVGKEDIIADWKKPIYFLREDYKALTLDKRFYYEIVFDFWTYDEEEEDGN